MKLFLLNPSASSAVSASRSIVYNVLTTESLFSASQPLRMHLLESRPRHRPGTMISRRAQSEPSRFPSQTFVLPRSQDRGLVCGREEIVCGRSITWPFQRRRCRVRPPVNPIAQLARRAGFFNYISQNWVDDWNILSSAFLEIRLARYFQSFQIEAMRLMVHCHWMTSIVKASTSFTLTFFWETKGIMLVILLSCDDPFFLPK